LCLSLAAHLTPAGAAPDGAAREAPDGDVREAPASDAPHDDAPHGGASRGGGSVGSAEILAGRLHALVDGLTVHVLAGHLTPDEMVRRLDDYLDELTA
jgi:hypothetical protein